MDNYGQGFSRGTAAAPPAALIMFPASVRSLALAPPVPVSTIIIMKKGLFPERETLDRLSPPLHHRMGVTEKIPGKCLRWPLGKHPPISSTHQELQPQKYLPLVSNGPLSDCF